MSIPPTQSDLGPARDDKTLAMASYILGVVTGFIGPLIIWVLRKINRSLSPTTQFKP